MGESILVVDDDPDVARFIEVNVRSAGYEVNVASDGEEALAMAAELRPDLILLDVMMPKVDGWEMLRRVRERHGVDSIPVIMFSGKVDSPEEAEAHGAQGFIGKPFDPQQLIESTKQLVPV